MILSFLIFNIKKIIDGQERIIKLDKAHYINHLEEFITSKCESKVYNKIVGSHLRFIEDRLKGIYEASNNGTHETITSKLEANRIAIYTYLLIGDILNIV